MRLVLFGVSLTRVCGNIGGPAKQPASTEKRACNVAIEYTPVNTGCHREKALSQDFCSTIVSVWRSMWLFSSVCTR